jgi:hypothetical protein
MACNCVFPMGVAVNTMNKLSLALLPAAVLVVSITYGQAPPDPPAQQREASLASTQPAPSSAGVILPDAPVPKAAASPCPAGVGRPCALLGGVRYLPDQLHVEEHDASWAKAMSHPVMIAVSSLLVGASVADYKMTRYCVDRHIGREVNPLLGQSRAQQLGVTVAATAATVWAAGKLKEKGNGAFAVFGLWGFTVAHTFLAYENAETCGY